MKMSITENKENTERKRVLIIFFSNRVVVILLFVFIKSTYVKNYNNKIFNICTR